MHAQRSTITAALLVAVLLPARGQAAAVPVGIASVDITPEQPVRMYGYGSRTTESEGVAGRLYAKALAIGSDAGEGPAVLLSVDCGAVPATLVATVYDRLRGARNLKPERFVLCNTHTHAGPNIKGARGLPPKQRDCLLAYSARLCDRLEKVVTSALAARRPAHVAWAEGSVGFAANRRVLENGKWKRFGADLKAPADHSLPVLRISDPGGTVRAVLLNYACHATTLRGNFTKIHGDWPGTAQQYLQADHPGMVAMVCIGCGADADPYPHGTIELARKHGRAVADAVERLLQGPWTPIDPTLSARRAILQVPYGNPPPPEELKERAKSSWSLTEVLKRIERGEKPPILSYPITTWTFGDDLAMVFLTGEVVVDYALRLKRELKDPRLWITAYTHAVPCYIASKRIIEEGGYEARNSLSSRISYGRPHEVSPAMEDRIVKQVRKLLQADKQ